MNDKKNRKHPKWCRYPVTGYGHPIIDMCWSFYYGYVTGKSHCKKCEYFKDEPIGEER